MKKGTKLKKVRKSGFLTRMKTVSGKRIIRAKRKKQKHRINIS
uniref:Ribosomal protein L34 n=1 Tax=Thuretia quercifolia TaxID=189650 RepID=A0A1Z1MJS2_9FLOR|nr:ribosomal protein L34 [Thuretia quercifolia]ARW66317.1 ribosomal protein L34 [Thuretia quercifolia]